MNYVIFFIELKCAENQKSKSDSNRHATKLHKIEDEKTKLKTGILECLKEIEKFESKTMIQFSLAPT